jgi:hypothetical protein
MPTTGLCPGCGKQTQGQWLCCAYCEQPLRSPLDGRSDALHAESDATAHSKAVLAVLGGVSLLLATLFAMPALVGGDPRPLAVLAIGIVALLGASTVVYLVRNKGEFTVYSFRRIVAGSFTLLGALTVIGFVLVFAGAVFGFVVCAVGGRC